MMPINCQICHKEFKSLITSTHLKTHNIDTAEYKRLYGENSLCSPEHKAKLKNRPIRTGWNHSDEAKQKMSSASKGREAYNKGVPMSEEQKEKLREAALKRPKRYGQIFTDETKKKISNSVCKYAINHPEELKERAKKSVETRQKPGGYFDQKKQKTAEKRINQLKEWGYSCVINAQDVHVTCDNCNNTFSRIDWGMMHEKMCKNCHPPIGISKEETELYEWISGIYPGKIIRSDKSIFGNGFEIDILLPELNIGIEYNGLYWHSENNGKSKWYHKQKYLKAKEKNIFLIQIFEDEWLHRKEIVKQRLISKIIKNQKSIGGRKCSIKQIDNKEANEFLSNQHLQGKGYGSHSYGLYYDDDLVSVMKFSHMSKAKGYNKNNQVFELNRFASKIPIAGGASKIFKYFLNDINPQEVISYSDLRWNTGQVYTNIGMVFQGETTPGYWYINNNRRIHRFKLKKTHNDPKDITEWELRKQQGWNRIWDCGHAKYSWKKPE